MAAIDTTAKFSPIMPGRSIRVFLIEGNPSGPRTAELGLSTTKALVIPRASLVVSSKRSEVQRTGVYMLVGRDPENPGLHRVYIGEGDNIFARLSSHDKDPDKQFWDEAILLVSKDANLTKAHGRYLEARLILLAKQAKRSTVVNGTEPSGERMLPEADEVEMEEFIEQARLLVATLGYDLFAPHKAQAIFQPSSSIPVAVMPVFTYEGQGFSAECMVDAENGQFVVKQGSKARLQETSSLQPTYRNLRKNLVASGVLLESGEGLTFVQDYEFSSITAAAQVVGGTTVNGRAVWVLKGTDATYAEWQDSAIKENQI